jgi:glycosyltransferase involved in cell wall biosynthesis
MKISIALATYNGARHLEEQLRSLAAQTLLPYELVATDDGSTDDTLAILRRFAAISPFAVRIYSNPQRLGYSANFLHAVSLCKGDWIALCDQDDVWLADKLRKIASAAVNDVTLVVHPVRTVDAELRPVDVQSVTCRVKLRGGPFRLATFGYFAGLGVAFKRDVADFASYRPRFPDRHNAAVEAAHDEWLCGLADALGSTRKIDSRLVLYRQHGHNTCGAWSSKSAKLYPPAEQDAQERYALLALAYAQCFEELRSSIRSDAQRSRSLEAAVSHYRQAHRYFTLRGRLYRSTSPVGRLTAWGRLTAHWLYRFNPGAAPLLACLKDLAASAIVHRAAAAPDREQDR